VSSSSARSTQIKPFFKKKKKKKKKEKKRKEKKRKRKFLQSQRVWLFVAERTMM
jgi:hypothetical protein